MPEASGVENVICTTKDHKGRLIRVEVLFNRDTNEYLLVMTDHEFKFVTGSRVSAEDVARVPKYIGDVEVDNA